MPCTRKIESNRVLPHEKVRKFTVRMNGFDVDLSTGTLSGVSGINLLRVSNLKKHLSMPLSIFNKVIVEDGVSSCPNSTGQFCRIGQSFKEREMVQESSRTADSALPDAEKAKVHAS